MGLPLGLTLSFIGTFKKPYPWVGKKLVIGYWLLTIHIDNQAFRIKLI